VRFLSPQSSYTSSPPRKAEKQLMNFFFAANLPAVQGHGRANETIVPELKKSLQIKVWKKLVCFG